MNEYLDLEENKDTYVELSDNVIHQNQCNSFKNFNQNMVTGNYTFVGLAIIIVPFLCLIIIYSQILLISFDPLIQYIFYQK